MTVTALAPTRSLMQVALLPSVVVVVLVAAPCALAQNNGNAGAIVVERDVMPRDAFRAVPRSDNPIAVQAQTFPAQAFDTSVTTLVSDADLTQAHGSQGVPGGPGAGVASMQVLTKLLGGSATGSNVAMGPGGIAPSTTGVGGTISMSVTGALAPLSAGLAGLGGLK